MSPYDYLANGIQLDPMNDHRVINPASRRAHRPTDDRIAAGAFRLINGIDTAIRRLGRR